MLYKPLGDEEYETKFDRDHISVLPFSNRYADQVRILLLDELPKTFLGINDDWVDGLFNGYERRDTNDVNAKYKLIYLAIDRDDQVRGVLGATPKKGSPIKLMPFIARDLPSFVALLKDIPFSLREYGHKLYIHTAPTPDQVIALQQNGWLLNGAMPAAYHPEVVTQQWSLDVDENKTMRTMRVKERFLKYIEEGTKDLEVRVAYTAIKSIRIDELIEFTSRTRNVMVRVTDIRNYGSFDEMLTFESPDRIVPGESRMSLLKILRDIYPLHKERLGVVVIQITSVNSD